MMNATLSRVMCNLAGLMPGEIMLDPFCGGGGILCEASYIGARTIGIDLNWRLLSGSKENLSFTDGDYSVIQGDVRSLPIQQCDCIVTDPPYGRASSTRGARAIELVESLFERIDTILVRRLLGTPYNYSLSDWQMKVNNLTRTLKQTYLFPFFELHVQSLLKSIWD